MMPLGRHESHIDTTGEPGSKEPTRLHPVDDLLAPGLRRFCHDWSELRQGRLLPEYRDFDIFDFRYIIGRLNVMEVERNPWRFRYRVHSSEAARSVGKDMTGTYVDDYPADQFREKIQDFYQQAAQRTEPSIGIESDLPLNNILVRWEAVAVPFGTAEGLVTHLAIEFSSSRPE